MKHGELFMVKDADPIGPFMRKVAKAYLERNAENEL